MSWESFSNCSSLDRLVIHDVLYGSISFSPLVKSIVDTEQFQRLRNIKQLGVTTFVFPSAVHTRFEHSIGTAYLCEKFLITLRDHLKNSKLGQELTRKLSDELITDKDIICVQLAGLLHDIGHGPFSHMFEMFDKTNSWVHEEMSCKIIDNLIETNAEVRQQMWLAGLTLKDIDLVKRLIIGLVPKNRSNSFISNECDQCDNYNKDPLFKVSEQLSHFETKFNIPRDTCIFSNNIQKSDISCDLHPNEHSINNEDNDIVPYVTLKDEPDIEIKKWFLFQIVSNKFDGIDCDKFDYMMRDCHYTGVSCNFDVTRYFQNCLLLQTTIDGIYICPRDKEFLNINELFYSRWRLHRKVYKHKTVKPIELMLLEALRLADDYFNIQLALDNPEQFLTLTDHIYYKILYSNHPKLEKSKHIIKCITKRKIPKLCSQVTLPTNFYSIYKNDINIHDKICYDILKYDENNILNPSMIHVDILEISCGMNIANPIDTIIFHTKNGQLAKLRPQCVSSMIPKVFSDKILRLYFGSLQDGYDSTSMEEMFNYTVSYFHKWCLSNDLPLPHAITMKDTTGYFTHIPRDKILESRKRNIDSFSHINTNEHECDQKITKKLQF